MPGETAMAVPRAPQRRDELFEPTGVRRSSHHVKSAAQPAMQAPGHQRQAGLVAHATAASNNAQPFAVKEAGSLSPQKAPTRHAGAKPPGMSTSFGYPKSVCCALAPTMLAPTTALALP